jgi:hypothetical protein
MREPQQRTGSRLFDDTVHDGTSGGPLRPAEPHVDSNEGPEIPCSSDELGALAWILALPVVTALVLWLFG